MNRLKLIVFASLTVLAFAGCRQEKEFKVLQFNIWQEGTVVEGGFDAVADQIIRSGADFVTLSEVRNYNNTRFCDRIVEALKERGATYYSFYSEDSGLLSRYPISDSTVVFPLGEDHGTIHRAVIPFGDKKIALYTAHLDYLNCAYYDVRGYDGSTWREREPVRSVDSLLAINRQSRRDDAIASFLKTAEKDREAGYIVILGGDFNEPSHLDWTEETKDMREHHGMVVPWTVSVMLADAGYKDAYRELYPDPVLYPGFTYPADCSGVGVEKLAWAPLADERDRIDYIMYSPAEGVSLTDVAIVGPRGDILRGERVTEQISDPVIEPSGIWPTDHKAVLATFKLK